MSDEVRRGTVISFDPTLWQAAILLDGGDVEATIPVGQWVSADTMTVDSAVAVLIFGETNTDDGVVLGPYGALGSAGIPTFAGLNLSGDLEIKSAAENHLRAWYTSGAAGHKRMRITFSTDDAILYQALNDDGSWQADMLKIWRPSTGNPTALNAALAVANGFGANGKTAQTAFAGGGAAPAGGTGIAAGGWDTAAHRDAAITLLNNIRAALVANGIMS